MFFRHTQNAKQDHTAPPWTAWSGKFGSRKTARKTARVTALAPPRRVCGAAPLWRQTAARPRQQLTRRNQLQIQVFGIFRASEFYDFAYSNITQITAELSISPPLLNWLCQVKIFKHVSAMDWFAIINFDRICQALQQNFYNREIKCKVRRQLTFSFEKYQLSSEQRC